MQNDPGAGHTSCDVLVIGAGAAGLGVALRLAGRFRVTVIAKTRLREGSTFYAQGGRKTLAPKPEEGAEGEKDGEEKKKFFIEVPRNFEDDVEDEYEEFDLDDEVVQ